MDDYMNTEIDKQHMGLPSGTRIKLDEFRRLVWVIKISEGLLAGTFALACSYLLVFVLDRFWDTPSSIRGAILLVGALGMGLWFPLVCHRWVWRRRTFAQVARLLTHRFPRLADQLLGIIELARSEHELKRSSRLVEAAMAQVDERVRGKDFTKSVPNPRHLKWALAAGITVLLAIVAFLSLPEAGKNALARWLTPWRDTARYTFTKLAPLEAGIVVPMAEPFEQPVALAQDSDWRPAVGSARYNEQQEIQADLKDDAYLFTVPAQTASGTLAICVGDTKETIEVTPMVRPELTEIKAEITLPDYLQRSGTEVQDVRGGTISILKGSQTRFLATASRELKHATINGVEQEIQDGAIATDLIDVDEPVTLTAFWKCIYGLSCKDPFEIRIQPIEDKAPKIYCENLSDMSVVALDDTLVFNIQAQDDFGINEIGLEWTGGDESAVMPDPAETGKLAVITGEKVIATGKPDQRQIEVLGTFTPSLEHVEPQALLMRAYVVDYRRNGERTYSSYYYLNIVNEDEYRDHLRKLIDDWYEMAGAAYDIEQKNYQKNQEFLNMSPEELASDEVRRRLQEQVHNELGNAERVRDLVDAGMDLHDKALQSDMSGEQVSKLDAMLTLLENIEKTQMPLVAKLLQETSQAPASSGTNAPPGQASSQNSGANDTNSPSVKVDNSLDIGQNSTTNAQADSNSSTNYAGPDVSMKEHGFAEQGTNGPAAQSGDPSSETPMPPTGMQLPTVSVPGAPGEAQPQAEEEEQSDDSEEDAEQQELLEEALEKHRQLMEDFARIAEELQAILDDLEGSTFLKRLKAASRRQLEIAGTLEKSMCDSFGLDVKNVRKGHILSFKTLQERMKSEAEIIYNIRTDLDAYYERRGEETLGKVLGEMKEYDAAAKARAMFDAVVSHNYSGRTLARVEVAADTLDRWAELFLGPPEEGDDSEEPSDSESEEGEDNSESGDDLTPDQVLNVMKLLHGEMKLREETRTLEHSKSAISEDEHKTRSRALKKWQTELVDTADALVGELGEATPGGAAETTLDLVELAVGAMKDAEELLAGYDTGAKTIAAETEVIETLLQAQRQNQSQSQQSQSIQLGQTSGAYTLQEAELDLIKKDGDKGSASGTAGEDIPDEFRAGLDVFFNLVEEDK